jgi:DNA transposition AAA+ family ATPase
MLDKVETPEQDNAVWGEPKNTPSQLSEAALNAWKDAVTSIRSLATDLNLSQGELCRRADIPQGTFSPWYDGTYTGSYANTTKRVAQWLKAETEKRETQRHLIKEPDFVETPTARKLLSALRYAQTAPAMIVATLGPGMGKTTVARHIANNTPHAYRVVMRPSTGSVHSMLRAIAAAVAVTERDPSKVASSIGEKLKRNGRHTLLMMDEAQNLSEPAVNELRFFMDEYGVGIALLGNEDVHAKFGSNSPREGYGQIHRRIGMRIRQLQPTPQDIDAFVAAWDITDMGVMRLLRVIGKKPGALGQITETLKLAAILASTRSETITEQDVRAAWINRGGEEIK